MANSEESKPSASNSVSWVSWPNLLVGLGLVLMLVNVYLIFMVAPTDAVLGNVQRVFYFHVPIAIMSFLGFFLVFIASVLFLVKRAGYTHISMTFFRIPLSFFRIPIPGRPEKWDRLAQAAAEVGVVFVTLTLLTGVIWARPVWGVWWTWEPRLTTTLILWLIYVAYLMVRSYAPNRAQGAILAAAVGIVGFVDVPIVYYSVQWWRSIHPSAVVGPLAQAGSLEPVMQLILLFSFIAFLVVFLHLLIERVALRTAEDQVRLLRFSLYRASG